MPKFHGNKKEKDPKTTDKIDENEHGLLPETRIEQGMEKLIKKEELIRFFKNTEKQKVKTGKS